MTPLELKDFKACEKTYHQAVSAKTKKKIGKALGLEKAAQVAVEELSAKGLLDEGGMKEKLQTIKSRLIIIRQIWKS